MTNDAATASELVALIDETREAVAVGDLTLRQLARLTDAEVVALRREARWLARRGRPRQAATLYGLLCNVEPLQHRHWQALATMQRRLGRQLEADACEEIARCLGGDVAAGAR